MRFIILILSLSLSVYQSLSVEVVIRGSSPRQGVTGEQCDASEFCEGSRKCVDIENILARNPCQSSSECVCLPESLETCNSSNDCQTREACGTVPQFSQPICLSAVLLGFSPDYPEINANESRPQVSDSVGLSFYPCKIGDTCKGSRQCLDEEGQGAQQPCKEGKVCQCYPDKPQFCSDSAMCEAGEVCANTGGIRLCIAADVVAALSILSPVESLQGEVSTEATASPSSEVIGETEQPNQSNQMQEIIEPSNEGHPIVTTEWVDNISTSSIPHGVGGGTSVSPSVSTQSGSLMQASMSPVESASMSPSPSLSVSVSLSATASVSVSPSVSQTSSSNNGAISSGVCIDADALGEFSSDELVFTQHSLATVLCDPNGSCATAGHIVVWKSGAMMMRSYCAEIGGCTERAMAVNSPRIRRGLRIASKTRELEYTAFAARFETAGEEKILQLAVRFGL